MITYKVEVQNPELPIELENFLLEPIHFNGTTLTYEDCCAIVPDQKIQMIKIIRGLTGWGLKESKEWCDAIYAARHSHPTPADFFYALKRVLNIPVEPGRNTMSKETFMACISEVIDHAEGLYFLNYLDCLKVWIENVEKRGGLNAIQKHLDRCIEEM